MFNFHKYLLIFSLFITLIPITTPAKPNNNDNPEVSFIPPDEGQPTTTTSGGTRPVKLCLEDTGVSQPSVTPLMPVSASSFTVISHPTFFIYIPETAAQNLIFSIRDASENYYYQHSIPLEGKSGIISFQLPEDAPPLALNQDYLFSFTIACTGVASPNDFVWSGQIRRVDLPVNTQNTNSLELANIYGENGIWLDMLAIIAQAKLEQPNDTNLTQNWQKILNSVGLENIAEQPILK
jgi:hypothetical protein